MYKTWYIRKGEQIYGTFKDGAVSNPLRTAPDNVAVKGKDTGYGEFSDLSVDGAKKLICFEAEGSKFYAWAYTKPKGGEKRPWYQILGQGTFKGVGLGLEFSKLPKTIQYLIYLAIALAIRWVFKKYKK